MFVTHLEPARRPPVANLGEERGDARTDELERTEPSPFRHEETGESLAVEALDRTQQLPINIRIGRYPLGGAARREVEERRQILFRSRQDLPCSVSPRKCLGDASEARNARRR